MRILVVEDEKRLAAHIVRALSAAGHTLEERHTGPEGLALAREKHFELIVLDVNLPSMSGFSVLRELRDCGKTSRVLILTARSDIDERVAALNAGADDYLTKPFSMDELVARVAALGRRQATPEPTSTLTFENIHMDVVRRKVTLGVVPVDLTTREFEVLQVLMQEPGRAFSRDEICERIWERQHRYDTNSVEVFIFRLRKKLDEGRARSIIQTVRNTGYTMRRPE